MKSVYLDNAATTRPDERVVEAMLPYLSERFGNPSSIHRAGRETKVMLEEAREQAAGFIGAKPSEIFFTSGGTEANNLAVKGTAFHALGTGKNHIISTKIEHSSVLDSLEYLKLRFGFQVTYIGTDRFGVVDIEQLKDSITEKTFLACVMHSNNELGVINDIKSISVILHERGVHLHTDSVQSIGKINFNAEELGCDTAALSSHKIFGPKGIGALYIRSGTRPDKLVHGGKQERDMRGGTENIPSIAGFKRAIGLLEEEMEKDIKLYGSLKSKLIKGLKEDFGGRVIINSHESLNSLPNIVNISFDMQKLKVDPETIIMSLDMKGIAVSSGSACTSGAVQPSHVLKAVGYDDLTAKSSLRVSFGRYNSPEDVEYFLECLKEIVL